MSNNVVHEHEDEEEDKLTPMIRLTHILYALQAVCFIFGVTYLLAIIALIINYVKFPDVKKTWLESHFRWQIRTFWFGLMWTVIGLITIFIAIGWLILFLNYVWLMYRVIKGWIYLNDRKKLKIYK